MGCRYATSALLIVAALTRRAAAVPQLAAGGDASAPLELGHMSRAFQLSCHSSGDAVADLPELTAKLAFVQGVCCTQLHESCELEMLPTSCGEPACARVVKLVADACGPMLSSSDFFSGFRKAVDAAAHVCADVPAQRVTYTMADPTLRLSPIASPGRLTDGMGVPGHWTATGQERVTIRAPPGQRVRFLLEAQWFGSSDVLILYNGNKRLAEMRGTKLPADPLFISSGEEMRVLLVTAEVGEGVATSFSALFDFVCEDDAGCGGRGKCTAGRCDCPAGYFGDGCEDDSCAAVDCGAHGVCERGGACRCADGYTGDHCEFKDGYVHKDGYDYLVLTGTGRLSYSATSDALCRATTSYSAARLVTRDPENWYIDTNDAAFATTTVEPGCNLDRSWFSTRDNSVGLSEVNTCDWTETTTATVDLSGTPFALDLAKAQRRYISEGWQESLVISCSDVHNQVCSFECGGACGDCHAADHQLPLVAV
jgi:hypothetical protein